MANLSDMNWSGFLIVCGAIAATRLMFKRVLPLRLVSMLTAATAGFILFLALPLLGYSNLFMVSVDEYGFLVWLAYLVFMIGAALARWLWGKSRPMGLHPRPSRALMQWAIAFSFLWVTLLFAKFIVTGGPARAIDVFFGGWAHFDEVARIGEQATSNSGQDLSSLLLAFLNNVFLCLWTVMFISRPKTALVLWGVYIVSGLDVYVSRSGLLGKAVVPLLAYFVFYRPSRRRLVVLLTGMAIIVLIYFSWNAAIRVGKSYDLSTEAVVSDTIRDAGNSAIPATIILSSNFRGDPVNYFASMATFLIPHAIWPDKPTELYNYDMTYFLTGMSVGKGTSVVTSTMLGEAWYYFGWTGTIWLMLLFGFAAYTFERVLTSRLVLIGLYFNIVYLTFIQIRSTFLTYYQAGIVAIITAGIIFAVPTVLRGKRRQNSFVEAPGVNSFSQKDASHVAIG